MTIIIKLFFRHLKIWRWKWLSIRDRCYKTSYGPKVWFFK